MGVPCPGCGRSYDVALFQFGRTIDCRCGCRVGAEARIRRIPAGSRPRFLADAMLGRLARWLRVLGYDAAWEAQVSDEDLVRRAVLEERIVLTRDRALESDWRVSDIRVVQAEEPLAQLAEVAAAYRLASQARPFSRCSVCNVGLESVSRATARTSVPPRVHASCDRFRRCPRCERFYWEGSHVEHMKRVIEALSRVPGDPT